MMPNPAGKLLIVIGPVCFNVTGQILHILDIMYNNQ